MIGGGSNPNVAHDVSSVTVPSLSVPFPENYLFSAQLLEDALKAPLPLTIQIPVSP